MLQNHKGGFCCLGVLVDIQGAKWKRKDGWSYNQPFIEGAQANRGCEDRLADKFACGLLYSEQVALSRMNDGGANFSELADHIEKNL